MGLQLISARRYVFLEMTGSVSAGRIAGRGRRFNGKEGKKMNSVVLCEIIMLVLFGLSWPLNISKSLRSRTTLGKSVAFEFIVVTGYFFGVAAKLITLAQTGVLQYSLFFYLIDIALVSADIGIYFRNLKIDKKEGRI